MLVAPSILSANFGNLDNDIKAICDANCDLVHIDVMDGAFVPNLTIGPVVVEAVAKVATKPLDIHLMVQDNNFFVDLFAPFKPEYISFHIENTIHANRLAQKIKSLGIKPSVVLNPHTPISSIEYLIEYLDMVLIMSVNPGFGGQKFIPNVLEKISQLKELILRKNPNCLIEVDGGVNNQNAIALKEAGADILVAGSYIFKHPDGIKSAIDSLRV